VTCRIRRPREKTTKPGRGGGGKQRYLLLERIVPILAKGPEPKGSKYAEGRDLAGDVEGESWKISCIDHSERVRERGA